VQHHKLDLDEIQSLDEHAVVAHKAHQAYAVLDEPVLVEDTSLIFTAMGHLPGPLVKWFLEELGNDGMCKLVDGLTHRKAIATVTYGYCDGANVHFFESSITGVISPKPRGTNGMGWDPIFIPEGNTKTFAEMTDEQKKGFSARAQAIEKLEAFLRRS